MDEIDEVDGFDFVREEDGSLSLQTAVQQAIGAASMCWSGIEKAGVFQADRAIAISEKLLGEIEKALIPPSTPDGAPNIGTPLTLDDCEIIFEAFEARQRNWPDEPLIMSLALVLINIGDRYASVRCTGGEWEGLLKDVPKKKGSNTPTCPVGHSLVKKQSLKLGWVVSD